ncbi:MAG: GGDEF domain-containing protein [Rhizobiaceae bacterium]|nr:GGDEF domain-containing protein [Rhizobiaceae bacterium]
MKGRTKRILTKSLIVSGIAVLATYAISLSVRAALNMPFDWLAWIECLVIPVAIAMPVASYIFGQSERISESCEALARSEAQLQAANAALAHRAAHDGMTGLLNREAFGAQLTASMRSGEQSAILLLDADHFKQINDRFGHASGDRALIAIAKTLKQSIGPDDIIGRLGGEEFGIVLKGLNSSVAAEQAAERLRYQVECHASVLAGLGPGGITVSIGGATTLEYRSDSAAVLHNADRCLYEAKRRGRNNVAFTYSKGAVA